MMHYNPRIFKRGAGGINHHADHHTLHRKNFGFGSIVIVDMLFGTNSNNNVYELGPYTVRKQRRRASSNISGSENGNIDTDEVIFKFDLTIRDETTRLNIETQLHAYYNPSLLSLAGCAMLAGQRILTSLNWPL